MKNIEVEVRGPLTKEQYNELSKKFSTEGEFVAEKKREAICYPGPETGSLVEKCNIDVRVRNTNGIPELIVKHGKWGAIDESRREYSVVGTKGKFLEMVEMLGIMGFKKGFALVRLGKVFIYKGVEFSITEVPNHSYFFEAEIMTDLKGKPAALKKINRVCTGLKLKLFNEQEMFDYVNVLNKEANKEFDFSKFDEKYFQRNFGIEVR